MPGTSLKEQARSGDTYNTVRPGRCSVRSDGVWGKVGSDPLTVYLSPLALALLLVGADLGFGAGFLTAEAASQQVLDTHHKLDADVGASPFTSATSTAARKRSFL